MDASVSLRYRQEVVTAEKEALSSSRNEMLVGSKGLEHTSETLSKYLDGSKRVACSMIRPRVSHRILGSVIYDALRYCGGVDKEAMRFMGRYVLPMARGNAVDKKVDQYNGKIAPNINESFATCPTAEANFVDVIRQIAELKSKGHKLVTVYHSEDGMPIALRKSNIEDTALSLVPFKAKGTSIPRGMILGINNETDITESGSYSNLLFNVKTYKVDGPLVFEPLRMSPWVYDDPLDRSLFAVLEVRDPDTPAYMPDRGQLVEGYTIDDFRQTAHDVMVLCGAA